MTTAALAFPLPHTGISSMTLQVPNPVAENHDDAWQLIANRDPSADGRIFYAVRTTGIFCRPSCPSRRPCRNNVEFFSDLLSAFEAGYRPCKRCNPAGLRAEAQLVENLCARLNRDLDRCVKLADLARVVPSPAVDRPGHDHRRQGCDRLDHANASPTQDRSGPVADG